MNPALSNTMNEGCGRPAQALALILFLMFGFGCVHQEQAVRSISHYQKRLVLSVERGGQVGQYAIRIVSIADDGLTQISIVGSEKSFAALPGGYFESREFGSHGLQLLAASKANGTAEFVIRGATYK